MIAAQNSKNEVLHKELEEQHARVMADVQRDQQSQIQLLEDRLTTLPSEGSGSNSGRSRPQDLVDAK
jgi:hypothetical protein